ncbi:MAG: type I methionyl aminopeptidase [Spirochaetaceae bacterium]|nr:MAG: type I methionyl aminopeptidase [Spirochaetaceae bacterium]
MIALKTPQDIDGIRQASGILHEAMKAMRNAIAPGITTRELDQIAHTTIIKRGGSAAFLGYCDYPASLCISVNEEVIHGIPGKRKLADGDIVGLDLGVIYNRYYSDSAVTVPVGKADNEDQRLIRVTEECLEHAIKKAVAGNRIRDISEAVYEHARQAGFDVVREYCGHGVGFALHEDPQIYNYPHPGPNPKLKAGMVLAIEPMINSGTWRIKILDDGWTVKTADNRKSAHCEHTVAIWDDRTEILTKW